MNHKISIAIGALLFAIIIGLITIYWNQLRGIWPAVLQPNQDIVQLIEESAPVPTQTQSPLSMPNGFSISIFAKNLDDPRVLAFDPNGVLLASIPAKGIIVALLDTDSNGKSEEARTIVSGLNKPHGIAVECPQNDCKLYVAETNAVSEYAYDPAALTATGKRMLAPLPSGGGHFTRTLLPYGNSLLVSVGSSCNVCVENDPNRAKILEIAKDTGKTEIFATGLRNAVFMAFHPVTRDVWATEMGRDLLGDDVPPDEINILKKGAHYGWPTCYGKNIHDTAFDKNIYIRNPCMEPFETPSHIDIPAHSAPLGLAFIPDSWPTEYRNDLLVAYHGSWNRSIPTGYKIVHMKFDANGTYESTADFITGWLDTEKKALGRPVDILFAKNGTAYISDDKAGVVYRLTPPK